MGGADLGAVLRLSSLTFNVNAWKSLMYGFEVWWRDLR